MHPDLISLIDLQKTIGHFDALRDQSENLPKLIEECKNEHQQVIDEHEEVVRNYKQIQVDMHDAEVDLRSGEETLSKKQLKLHEVKTNEEYKAVQHEIEVTHRKNSETETRILELMDQVEEAKAKVATSGKKLKKDQQEFAGKLKQLEDRLCKIQKEIETFGPATKAKRASLKPALVAKFDRIYERNHGMAVASVHTGFCAHCQINMPMHRIQAAQQGRDLVLCDACGCILYWDNELEEQEKVRRAEVKKKEKEKKKIEKEKEKKDGSKDRNLDRNFPAEADKWFKKRKGSPDWVIVRRARYIVAEDSLAGYEGAPCEAWSIRIPILAINDAARENRLAHLICQKEPKNNKDFIYFQVPAMDLQKMMEAPSKIVVYHNHVDLMIKAKEPHQFLELQKFEQPEELDKGVDFGRYAQDNPDIIRVPKPYKKG